MTKGQECAVASMLATLFLLSQELSGWISGTLHSLVFLAVYRVVMVVCCKLLDGDKT